MATPDDALADGHPDEKGYVVIRWAVFVTFVVLAPVALAGFIVYGSVQ